MVVVWSGGGSGDGGWLQMHDFKWSLYLGLLLFMKFEIESFSVFSMCKCNYPVSSDGREEKRSQKKNKIDMVERECFL